MRAKGESQLNQIHFIHRAGRASDLPNMGGRRAKPCP